MKIGILGAKNIGAVLGRKWLRKGHSITFGVRNPEHPDYQWIRDEKERAFAGSVQEAIRYGEVILFAVPGAAVEEIVGQYAADLENKIIIDAANNIQNPVMNGYRFFEKRLKSFRYYRAFNSLGWENFENPVFPEGTADLFYCGTPGASQTAVDELIGETGIRPQYIGAEDRISVVDSIGALWFAMVFGQKHSRHLAFKVLED